MSETVHPAPGIASTARGEGPSAPPPQHMGVPSAISADLLRPHPRGPSLLMLGLVGLVCGFIAWAGFARIEEATRGEGRVIPASKIQLVQNLEGGIIREIGVREGDRISAGDVILRIDPTQADASHGETRERILALQALSARLEAELAGTDLAFPSDVANDRPDLIQRHATTHTARRRELDAALAAFDSQLQQRQQELVELEAKVVNLTTALEIAEEQASILAPLAKSRAAFAQRTAHRQGKSERHARTS